MAKERNTELARRTLLVFPLSPKGVLMNCTAYLFVCEATPTPYVILNECFEFLKHYK